METYICAEALQIDEDTAVAIGFFDGLHLGHRQVISRAVAAKGLAPCVFSFDTDGGLNPKGEQNRLLSSYQKEEILKSWGIRYYFNPPFSVVQSMSCEECVRFLNAKLRAKMVVVGEDFRFGRGAVGDIDLLQNLCTTQEITVEAIPAHTLDGIPVRSTVVRQCLREGEIERANRLLGFTYNYRFPVIRGNQLGRTIDFPTINQQLPADYVLPRFGVYGSAVKIGDKQYLSITNIGEKPTVGSLYPLAETYIENFSGDLYGEIVEVSLYNFIRPEQKFASVQALKEQIGRDVETNRRWFIERGILV